MLGVEGGWEDIGVFAGLREEKLLDVVDKSVAVVAEGDGAEGGRITGVFLWFGCEDLGDVFGIGVCDLAQEGELDEVEAEVGVLRWEATKDCKVKSVWRAFVGWCVIACRKWCVVSWFCVNWSVVGWRRKG